MPEQPYLSGLPEFDVCRRCNQQPVIEYWDEPGDGEGCNVFCACRTISGEREGMAAAWNREASKLRRGGDDGD